MEKGDALYRFFLRYPLGKRMSSSAALALFSFLRANNFLYHSYSVRAIQADGDVRSPSYQRLKTVTNPILTVGEKSHGKRTSSSAALALFSFLRANNFLCRSKIVQTIQADEDVRSPSYIT